MSKLILGVLIISSMGCTRPERAKYKIGDCIAHWNKGHEFKEPSIEAFYEYRILKVGTQRYLFVSESSMLITLADDNDYYRQIDCETKKLKKGRENE